MNAIQLEIIKGYAKKYDLGMIRQRLTESQRSRTLVLLELIWFWLSPRQRLSPHEYFMYQFHKRRLPYRERRSYAGEWFWDSYARKLNRHSRRILQNKLLLTYLIEKTNLPIPRTQAVINVSQPLISQGINSPGELHEFLCGTARFPLFIKPIHGSQGIGCMSFNRILPDMASLELVNGDHLAVSQLSDALFCSSRMQYLAQDRLASHPAFEAISGHACPTVRITTVVERGEVRILFAVLKVPSRNATTDNLHSSSRQKTTLLAQVDVESGEFLSLARFDGVESNPIGSDGTGILPGVSHVPSWNECKGLVMRTHELDKSSLILGWDIAVTKDGPVILEANGRPGVDLYQLAAARGFYQQEMANRLALLRRATSKSPMSYVRKWFTLAKLLR